MNLTKALGHARDRVHIVSQGRKQYVLHTWSPKHDATWVSHSMDLWGVRMAAKEAKIEEALRLLGVEEYREEANCLAQHEGRWDVLVRDYLAGRRA